MGLRCRPAPRGSWRRDVRCSAASVEAEVIASEHVEVLLDRFRETSRTEEQRTEPVEITPDLIRQLARQLSLADGEDPDEQPFPLRRPLWQQHYTRAKTLLSVTPAEQRALAAVLAR